MAMLSDGGPITVRIYKRKNTNPSFVWANTYEMTQTAPGSSAADFTDLANALASAEAQLHFISTEYLRAVVSTEVEDGKPYNPLSFIAVPLGQLGQVDETGVQVEPLHMCLRVAFGTEFGRQGFRLYRNCLSEADVTSPGGVPIIQFGALSDRFTAFQTAMAPFIMDNPQNNLVLASDGNIRSVTSVSVAGVTVKKMNNRYFDQVLR